MSQASTSPASFHEVVGSRRSIRWFEPDRHVSRTDIQRVLEAVRLTGSPGNLQPWRAVVVEAAEAEATLRNELLEVNNRQSPQVLAPVWIYWYADPESATPSAFLEGVRTLLAAHALPPAFGWSEERARAAIQDGERAAPGMPALDRTVHELPPQVSAALAIQETNAACTLATLAAVSEGLGTCLLSIADPTEHDRTKRLLGVPSDFHPVWLQLIGHPAESPKAGGQRPRAPFETLFALRKWGEPFPQELDTVNALRRSELLQPEAPLPGRAEELERLRERFEHLLEDDRSGALSSASREAG